MLGDNVFNFSNKIASCSYWALFAVNVERSVKNIQVGDVVTFSFNILGSVQWISQEIAVALNGGVCQLDRIEKNNLRYQFSCMLRMNLYDELTWTARVYSSMLWTVTVLSNSTTAFCCFNLWIPAVERPTYLYTYWVPGSHPIQNHTPRNLLDSLLSFSVNN